MDLHSRTRLCFYSLFQTEMISGFLLCKLNYYWGNKWACCGQRRMKNLTKAKRKEEDLMTSSMSSIIAVLLLLLRITAPIATTHVKAADCLDWDLSILKTPPAILWHTGWRWNFISSTRLRSTQTRALQWKHGSAQHSRVICHNIWTVTQTQDTKLSCSLRPSNKQPVIFREREILQ